jgi:hypothetical protein
MLVIQYLLIGQILVPERPALERGCYRIDYYLLNCIVLVYLKSGKHTNLTLYCLLFYETIGLELSNAFKA